MVDLFKEAHWSIKILMIFNAVLLPIALIVVLRASYTPPDLGSEWVVDGDPFAVPWVIKGVKDGFCNMVRGEERKSISYGNLRFFYNKVRK